MSATTQSRIPDRKWDIIEEIDSPGGNTTYGLVRLRGTESHGVVIVDWHASQVYNVTRTMSGSINSVGIDYVVTTPGTLAQARGRLVRLITPIHARGDGAPTKGSP